MQSSPIYTGLLNNPKVVIKTWGFERIFINTKLYCTKELLLNPNSKTSIHFHNEKHETFYISKGRAIINIYRNKKEESFLLNVGQSFCLEPKVKHSIRNPSATEKLIILESSTMDKPKDNIRVNDV